MSFKPSSYKDSPLPIKDGINATRLRVPTTGPWETIQEYTLHRFGHIDTEGLRRRFANGEVAAVDGSRVTPDTPLGTHEFIWYYRDSPNEEHIPFYCRIIHRDADLLVVDKPHFLPMTPGGRYVRESALARLRVQLNMDDLVPIHRLDRATAGVVMFSINPATRGAYQTMFERREVTKKYQAVTQTPTDWDPLSPALGGTRLPFTVRSHIKKTKGEIVVRLHDLHDFPPNAETRIRLAAHGTNRRGEDVCLWDLSPVTGRTHQLRVHLAQLGSGIIGDQHYPYLLDDGPDNHDEPLQLLAHTISFTDPLTGQPRSFTTQQRLTLGPLTPASPLPATIPAAPNQGTQA